MFHKNSICAIALFLGFPMLHAQERKDVKVVPSAEQMAMMEAFQKAATPGVNHKWLASFVGQWSYTNTMWMDPAAPPQKSTGSSSNTMILGGRYLQGEHKGTFMGMSFLGISITGYDNLAGRFLSTWIDNTGTTIVFMSGSLDIATKTLTLTGEMDDMMKPGTRIPVRQTLRILGEDAHQLEWFETRNGKETRTMEARYTRIK